LQSGKIAADQRLFLFPPPALDLPLGGRGILKPLEMLTID
jgi:hypothetical protein